MSLISKLKDKIGQRSVFELIDVFFRVFLTKWYLRKLNKVGKWVMTNGKPLIVNRGYLELGDEVRIWSNINRTKIFVEKGARLTIGRNTRINGAHISVSTDMKIGNNVRIAPYVIIIDDDYHDVKDHFNHEGGKKSPITIEDDVWIAMDAKILKGVMIGKGSVIATSSVVTKDVPPYTVVAGIPAKIIKYLK
ncbi:MAG: acyltransferase [Cytophagales bacterium]